MIRGATLILPHIVCVSIAALLPECLHAQKASWVRFVLTSQPVDDSLSDRSFKSKNGVYANFHSLTNPLLAGWKSCAQVEFRMKSRDFVPRMAIVQPYRHLGGQLGYDTLTRSVPTDSGSSEARIAIACPVQWEPAGERYSPYLVASSAVRGSRGAYGLTITVVESVRQVVARPAAESAEGVCLAGNPTIPIISLDAQQTLANRVRSATWIDDHTMIYWTYSGDASMNDRIASLASHTIWLWRDGAAPKMITHGRVPAPSPDGRRIAFLRTDHDGNQVVWVRDLASGHETQVGTWPDAEGLKYMRWSAEDRSLLIDEEAPFIAGSVVPVFDLDSLKVTDLPKAWWSKWAMVHPSTRWSPFFITRSPSSAPSWVRMTGQHFLQIEGGEDQGIRPGVWFWSRDWCVWQQVVSAPIAYTEVSQNHNRILGVYIDGRLAIWKVRETGTLSLTFEVAKNANWIPPSYAGPWHLDVYRPRPNPLTGKAVGAMTDTTLAIGWVDPPVDRDTFMIHVNVMSKVILKRGDVVLGPGGIVGFLTGVSR